MAWALDASGFRWPGDELGEPQAISPEDIAAARAFLSRCERAKTTTIGSYGLKHIIQSSCGQHITNGATLRAASDLGFTVTPAFTGFSILGGEFWRAKPINGWIHISRASVRRAAAQGLRGAR